jgi:hypothetical protein
MMSDDLLIRSKLGISVEVCIESMGALSETGSNSIPASLCYNYKKWQIPR